LIGLHNGFGGQEKKYQKIKTWLRSDKIGTSPRQAANKLSAWQVN